MRYLKNFENNKNKISVNLLDICNVIEGLYNTISYLKKYSKTYNISVEYNIFDVLKNCKPEDIELSDPIFDEYNIVDGDSESIKMKKGENISYGFIKSKEINVTIIFNNVNSYDDILIQLTADKYNL